MARIRGRSAFDGVDHLVATMADDCDRARLILDVPQGSGAR